MYKPENPIRRLDAMSTNPQAGVMATRPAMAPVQNASKLDLLINNASIATQVIPAIHADRLVVATEFIVLALNASSLPPLNPNQPNHNRPVPMSISLKFIVFLVSLPLLLVDTFICRGPTASENLV